MKRFISIILGLGAIAFISIASLQADNDVVSISVNPTKIHLKGIYSEENQQAQKGVHVTGEFSDGVKRDITLDSNIKYISRDESIAYIARENLDSAFDWILVRGKKEGATSVIVKMGNVSEEIPVIIEYN